MNSVKYNEEFYFSLQHTDRLRKINNFSPTAESNCKNKLSWTNASTTVLAPFCTLKLNNSRSHKWYLNMVCFFFSHFLHFSPKHFLVSSTHYFICSNLSKSLLLFFFFPNENSLFFWSCFLTRKQKKNLIFGLFSTLYLRNSVMFLIVQAQQKEIPPKMEMKTNDTKAQVVLRFNFLVIVVG